MYRRGRDPLAGGAHGRRKDDNDDDDGDDGLPPEQQVQQQQEELEQEDFPDNIHLEALEEYEEEEVYVMVELPAGVDQEVLRTSGITVKVC